MRLNKINVLFLLVFSVNAYSWELRSPISYDDENITENNVNIPVKKINTSTNNNTNRVNIPPNITPYQIPTFTGKPVDYTIMQPAINKLPSINSDSIFSIINKCYPLKSGFGLDISLKSGLTYKPDINSNGNTTVNTLDSQKYYAGIVASMPLYSDIEIDKDRKVEYQRRMQTTSTIKELLIAVATKRRAERLLGLYMSLEKRSQIRAKEGIASTDEQIIYLEKVATTQGDLDAANAGIEGARLALIGQCRPESVNQINNYILREIGEETTNEYAEE